MLPLASASGPAIIGVVVVGSGLFLWWLLREDASDEQDEQSSEPPDPR
jgi:hypothetical protein